MRQSRRSTPPFSFLTALRALAGVLLAAAVLSAPVPITAAQATAPVEPNRPRAGAPAQPAQAAPPPQVIYGNDRRNAEETRERLRDIINQYSPTLSQVFRHDPSLMSNVDYVGNYPALASFLQQHPEIAHNPSYFVGEPDWHRNSDPRSESINVWRDIMAGVMVFSGLLLAATLVTWLIKTLIDYRRWLRLTRIQTDAHTKLLDRLTSNDDLMAYIQSPSGRRFLESAPIALDSSGTKAVSAPVNRIMLSLQAGVVLASGGCGFLYASGRVIPEVGPALFTIGVLAIAFGSGFVASAILAYGLSERLGLLAPSSRPSAE
jgi:hypothetical protein